MFIGRKLLMLGVAGISLVPYTVYAQTAPLAPSTPTTAAVPDNTIPEVVVTAQKRSERLVNVPISLTAVSGAGLEKAGIQDMGSLAQVVPGLHVDQSGAFFQPSIRGVGTAISGAGASANVATYVDGIYKPNALSNNFDFIDVDSVQVLKGPQGTLFGRNTTGGAIVVTTKAPSFDPQAEVRFGYGSFNQVKGSAFASTGITDTLAASIAVGLGHSDGWTTNLVNGKDANPSEFYTVKGKLLFEPAPGYKFTLGVDADRVNDPSAYAASSWRGYSDAKFFGVPLTTDDPRSVSIGTNTTHITSGHGIDLKAEFDLGFATLVSISAGHWDNGVEATNESASDVPANGTLPTAAAIANGQIDYLEAADWHYSERYYSQEFDLRSNPGSSGPVDWVTGLYYFYDQTEYQPFNTGLYGPFGAGGLFSPGSVYPYPAGSYISTGPQNDFDFGAPNFSKAAFADVTYNLGNWHFTAGARLDADRTGVNYTGFQAIATGFTTFPRTSDNSNSYSITPRYVVRYNLTPDSNVYISYSRGTKAGLYNGSGYAFDRQPVLPEKLRDLEAGYKLATPTTRIEASVFHYDYRNLQVASYIGCCAVFQNAPASEIYGADGHIQQRLLNNLTLDVSGAYTHARYTSFPEAAYQFFSQTIGVQSGSIYNRDLANGAMQRTPTYSGTVALDYKYPIFGGTFDINGNYSFQTRSSFDFADTQTQAGYGLLNLRAAWTDPSDHWTVSLTGQNVTDTVYLVQILPNAGGFGQIYGPPASVFAQVDYTY